MSDFANGKEMLEHLLRRCGEILPESTNITESQRVLDAQLYINEAHWWACALRPWRWARRNSIQQFVSVAQEVVTVASIVNDVVTLTAPLATSVDHRKFMLDADGIPHRIVNHTANSASLTLQTPYAAEGTAGPATIFQDELDVPADILAWPHITDVRFGGEFRLVAETALREMSATNNRGVARAGIRYGAFIHDTKLRIAPWTPDRRLFEIAYNVRTAPLDFSGGANDVPLVPREFRGIVPWRAEFKVMADKRPEDKKLQTAKAEVDELVARMEAIEMGFATMATRRVPRGQRVSG